MWRTFFQSFFSYFRLNLRLICRGFGHELLNPLKRQLIVDSLVFAMRQRKKWGKEIKVLTKCKINANPVLAVVSLLWQGYELFPLWKNASCASKRDKTGLQWTALKLHLPEQPQCQSTHCSPSKYSQITSEEILPTARGSCLSTQLTGSLTHYVMTFITVYQLKSWSTHNLNSNKHPGALTEICEMKALSGVVSREK